MSKKETDIFDVSFYLDGTREDAETIEKHLVPAINKNLELGSVHGLKIRKRSRKTLYDVLSYIFMVVVICSIIACVGAATVKFILWMFGG